MIRRARIVTIGPPDRIPGVHWQWTAADADPMNYVDTRRQLDDTWHSLWGTPRQSERCLITSPNGQMLCQLRAGHVGPHNSTSRGRDLWYGNVWFPESRHVAKVFGVA